MTSAPVLLTASARALGSRLVPSHEVDAAYGMPLGKLRDRAGIESFAYATADEDEASLGAKACAGALLRAGEQIDSVDCLVAASETHHAFPSLSAVLHARLKLQEDCSALDVGSGCLALLQAFDVAQSMIESGRAGKILVVTADVHSRPLRPGRAAGEFGGLFGDGASAFLLCGEGAAAGTASAYTLGEFFFGCAAKYAEAITVSAPDDGGPLDVEFNGEALSRAAVSCMEKTLTFIAEHSGIPLAQVGAFATHQPNPRLVALLAKQLRVSCEAFPPIAVTSGNLGSSMCGVALDAALQDAASRPAGKRQPIFLASLAPGLLFGGGWLVPASA